VRHPDSLTEYARGPYDADTDAERRHSGHADPDVSARALRGSDAGADTDTDAVAQLQAHQSTVVRAGSVRRRGDPPA
jgi:hypothetical protein